MPLEKVFSRFELEVDLEVKTVGMTVYQVADPFITLRGCCGGGNGV